ncbi:MGDG synthase family glycosyltransferase [Paenibacillus sp. tmac-D7]|uniref:MGDG synthase family glycosyltransferase n=1 Tax=Paenibacillus sp. tmac-D7 TaxID=2591462 RepID=UPI0011429C3E|nr:glycosyltransferase [Paenibacillus sp. tmac-D7]
MYTKNQLPAPVRALILAGDLGDGHRQAARALAQGCGRPDSPVQAEVIDYMQEIYALLHPVIRYCFLKGVEKAPSLYGYFYRKSRMNEEMSLFSKSFLKLGMSKLLGLLRDRKPDVVICTFPLASAAVSLLKAQGLSSVPLVTVITDYADHALWVQPHTDLYLVGSEHVAQALYRRGISSSCVSVTGIPIRKSFFEPGDRETFRRQLGLDPLKPVVLVMGGGCGLMGKDMRALLRSEALRLRAQLVFVCGSNAAAKQSLEEELALKPTPSVRIVGFVEDIHRWMGAADMLLTKPGGLTTSEAVAMKLPMLLYKPIPGQEEENAAVLEGAGVAIRASKERKLLDQVLELIDSPGLLATMRQQAERFRCEQPTQRAWDAMFRLQAGPYEGSPAWPAVASVRESVREAW